MDDQKLSLNLGSSPTEFVVGNEFGGRMFLQHFALESLHVSWDV